jgi:hypothetical protein
MGKVAAGVALLLLFPVAPAGAQDPEHLAMARVRVTTEPGLARGCIRLGMVEDDSMKDLRRKIVRSGGNMGVLSFRLDDLEAMQVEVFHCSQAPPPPGAPPPSPTSKPPARSPR